MSTPGRLRPVEIVSFGYGHDDPPTATLTIDLRKGYHDPHFDPELRELTAHDSRVAAHVLATPGVTILVTVLVAAAFEGAVTHSLPVSLAIGCTGGRHRGPGVAAEVARQLRAKGVPVRLTHRDIGKPVIRRDAA